MTKDEVLDAVFDPSTRDAPMPTGITSLWPAANDHRFDPKLEDVLRRKYVVA